MVYLADITRQKIAEKEPSFINKTPAEAGILPTALTIGGGALVGSAGGQLAANAMQKKLRKLPTSKRKMLLSLLKSGLPIGGGLSAYSLLRNKSEDYAVKSLKEAITKKAKEKQ